MSLKVVIFNVWLNDSTSNIQYQEINDIPSELNQIDPIETIWIMKKIRTTLDSLVEDKVIDSYNEELFTSMTKEFQNNLESIEQDLDWKVRDYLGLKEL